MITAVTHVTLFVNNQEEALTFYTEKLGFVVHTDANMGDMRWLTLCAKGQENFEVVLYLATSAEEKAMVGTQGAGCTFLCLSSDNVEKDYQDMKAKGVIFTDTPEDHPWGKSVTFKDLYGNMIYLVQPPK